MFTLFAVACLRSKSLPGRTTNFADAKPSKFGVPFNGERKAISASSKYHYHSIKKETKR